MRYPAAHRFVGGRARRGGRDARAPWRRAADAAATVIERSDSEQITGEEPPEAGRGCCGGSCYFSISMICFADRCCRNGRADRSTL